MKFGCIADDFTGATDLAGLLRRSGASVKLHFGLPDHPSDGLSDIEIIALLIFLSILSFPFNFPFYQSCLVRKFTKNRYTKII